MPAWCTGILTVSGARDCVTAAREFALHVPRLVGLLPKLWDEYITPDGD